MNQSTILSNKTQYYSPFLEDTIWNLLDNTYDLPETFDVNIFKVNEEKYIGRPDIISYDAYGDAMFADIICKLNGISNPFELNMDQVIIIPSPSDIIKFTHQAPVGELESFKDDVYVPVPKKTNEKRKANEAIVGDKRFKIDPTKGIVIY